MKNTKYSLEISKDFVRIKAHKIKLQNFCFVNTEKHHYQGLTYSIYITTIHQNNLYQFLIQQARNMSDVQPTRLFINFRVL